ncbi:MAG: acyltransferase [Candidatus ainarchaeum sp.]|nr:acyltransferase [Candidatus ainarchaeum sp.]MDD5096190.1 acyltransferase [Candidatus ainarchaeum sp.]
MRRLQSSRVSGKNSLNHWTRFRNPLRVVYNFVVITLSRYAPSLALKRALLRMTGMNVGKDAAVGLMAMFDVFYPELIELGENCIIGYNTTILAHEFLRGEIRTGKTIVGKDAMVGANATVLAGVEIGAGGVVSAACLVDGDVPAHAFAKGNPMRVHKRAE